MSEKQKENPKQESKQINKKKELNLEKHESVPRKGLGENWFVPVTDFYEDKDGFYLYVEMPGVDEKNVDIDIYDDSLIVTGIALPLQGEDESLLYSEYGEGGYHRHFPVMEGIDRTKIDAKIKDGLLVLNLPKKEEYKPRKIPVVAG